ncbi:type IVB secretion system protein IcmH/DotU [Pseudomonas batumici]|uniref:Outer membrane protein ImpK/VasF, OmpA/MotB domain n=1 Tax=Pseudomonas batumici TaxID=226910 RepID=A0A0C2ICY0_9PSED|nr:type IVB secretion system protein IcmH/DotU [Pseudomonas batumici]KIH82857.1 Outer membrane protein ImpK/VasF, OmpA/MotB domain [Pseudomonas batumici]
MHKGETHAPRDDLTVLVGIDEGNVFQGPLTDAGPMPKVEQLQARMIHASRARPQETVTQGINCLVIAASDLLGELAAISRNESDRGLGALHERLVLKLEAFEAQALRLELEASQVMSARYVLCTALDEAVMSAAAGQESHWSKMSLLSRFHNETFGGEKFFQLLERLLQDPVKHLSLLELMYLCLALGFEGKYRIANRGSQALDATRDSLYRQIRQVRGEPARELSPCWQGLGRQPARRVRSVPGWLVPLFTLTCLGVMYSGFAWVLGEQRTLVLQHYPPQNPPIDLRKDVK